jgi:hypothetical protein
MKYDDRCPLFFYLSLHSRVSSAHITINRVQYSGRFLHTVIANTTSGQLNIINRVHTAFPTKTTRRVELLPLSSRLPDVVGAGDPEAQTIRAGMSDVS